MPKMTIAWLVIYFGSAAGAFVNPLLGLLGYLFEYYLRPSLHWWGQPLPELRWNLTISLILLVAYLVRRHSFPEVRPVRDPVLKWLLGLAFVMLLVTPAAVEWERSFNAMVVFLKYIAVYVLIVQIVRTRMAFDAFVAMHMAGATWWGWEAYREPRRAQSRLAHVGSADTLNDNLAAAHLLTVLPFIFVYLLTAKDKRLRALALVALPLVVNLFILCNSRGATLGLLVGALAALALVKHGHRMRLIAAVPLIAAVFWVLADPEFIYRQQTTANFDSDATALQRVDSWRGGWNLIKDHPFGTGGEGFEALSSRYISEIVAEHDGAARAPHNTWVLVAAEWGVPGLFLYLGLIASTMLVLWRVRKRAVPGDGFYYRAFALQVALVATLTASTFSDRFYGESFYWMCALAVALYRIPDEAVQTVPGFAVRPMMPAYGVSLTGRYGPAGASPL